MMGGGEEEDTATYTNAIYTSWLKVPSLKSMALEAACHYWQDTLDKEMSMDV